MACGYVSVYICILFLVGIILNGCLTELCLFNVKIIVKQAPVSFNDKLIL